MERATLSDILREVKHAPELHDRLARVVYNLGGGRVPFVFTTQTAAALLTNAETGVLTTPPLNPGIDSAVVLLLANYNISAVGTNGVQLVTKMRQGVGTAGTQTGISTNLTTVATNAMFGSLIALDTPGAVAGQQYTCTGTMLSASANSTIANGFMIALALG